MKSPNRLPTISKLTVTLLLVLSSRTVSAAPDLCADLFTSSELNNSDSLFREIRNIEDVVEIAPKTFAFSANAVKNEETQTLSRFVDIMGGRAFSIGNFREARGVPAVDAVYFPPGSKRPINLSIKTSFNRTRTHSATYIWQAIATAASSIAKSYSYGGMADFLGLKVLFGQAVASDRIPNRHSRLQQFEQLSEVAGIAPRYERDIAIVVDLSLDVTQSARLILPKDLPNSLVAQKPNTQPEDLILQITDSRDPSTFRDNPSLMNLSDFQRSLQEHSETRRAIAHYILFAHQFVTVTREAVTIRQLP